MILDSVIFVDSLPTLDIHGYDRETARVKIDDFIKDSIKLRHKIVVIVHGYGQGILKATTKEALSENKNVLEYKLYYKNNGCTLALIQFDN